MANIGQDVRELIFALLEETHTALPARIVSFDDSEMRAEVELLRTNEEGDAPVIVKCPVATIMAGDLVIVPPYSKGDEVLVVCAESDLEGPLHDGRPREPEYDRNHSLDDAIVMGGLVASQDSISVSGSSENLRVGDENGNGVLEVTPDSTVMAKFDDVQLGSGSTESLVKETFLTEVFDKHTHPGDSGGTTGKPNQTSGSADSTTSETVAS